MKVELAPEVELEPGTLVWRAYAYYYILGGIHLRRSDSLGAVARRILLWLPMRWLFSWEYRIAAIVWLTWAVTLNVPVVFLVSTLNLYAYYHVYQHFAGERYYARLGSADRMSGMRDDHKSSG